MENERNHEFENHSKCHSETRRLPPQGHLRKTLTLVYNERSRIGSESI